MKILFSCIHYSIWLYPPPKYWGKKLHFILVNCLGWQVCNDTEDILSAFVSNARKMFANFYPGFWHFAMTPKTFYQLFVSNAHKRFAQILGSHLPQNVNPSRTRPKKDAINVPLESPGCTKHIPFTVVVHIFLLSFLSPTSSSRPTENAVMWTSTTVSVLHQIYKHTPNTKISNKSKHGA